ncbi:MAG: hypothetical protein ACRC8W_13625 [Plesiomonas shigelloides]
MKQFKKGDAVKIIISKDKLCHDRLNGLAGTYIQETILGHFVFITDLGRGVIADDVELIGKTLLEILVDELPKRGGWPNWAAAAVQDEDQEIKFAGSGYRIQKKGIYWSGKWADKAAKKTNDFYHEELSTDHATKIVTREEYERAVAVKASEDVVKATVQRLTDACAQHEENESKQQRIERLHNAVKSAKAELDAEFKPIREVMNDLELGDYFTVNHNKDGLVNFRVIKVISELDGQGQAKDRKLFVKKISTGDEYALTKEDKSYAVKVS